MIDAPDSEQLALVFDLVVAVLLVATIVYAAILNRKLTELRAAKDEMALLLEDFGQATGRAESGLAALRAAADEVGEALQRDITKGNAVADDLMFLVERAGGLADRLEAAPAQGRTKGATTKHKAKSRSTNKSKGRNADKTAASEEVEKTDAESSANSAFMEALRGIR